MNNTVVPIDAVIEMVIRIAAGIKHCVTITELLADTRRRDIGVDLTITFPSDGG